jgi:Flp pilus assembly protein TadB
MDEQSLSEEMKENVTDSHVWMRLLFMLLFAFIYSVAEVVLMAVVTFQFLAVLFTSDKNERLLDFGRQLSTFIYQMLRYLTFNSEERPFPFDDWPSGGE